MKTTERAATLPMTTNAAAVHTRTGWHRWALVALISVALWAVLALLPLQNQRVDLSVGAGNPPSETTDAPQFYGFYDVEHADGSAYRWTKNWARFTVPYGARLGDTVQIRMRLCGCHPHGTQPTARFELDNQQIIALSTSAQYRRYALLVRPAADNPVSSLYLVLRMPTITLDARAVGARFDYVDVVGVPVRALPSTQALVLALLGVSVTIIITRLSRDVIARATLLTSLVAGPALVLLLYQRQELTPGALVLAELCGVLCAALARPPRWVALALAALMLALPFAPQLLGGWMIDDAFISFRYAQNLVAGQGLVFNSGERVEGYTNFLWTIIAAAILRLDGDPATITRLLTLIIGQVIIIISYRLGQMTQVQEPRTKNQEPDTQRINEFSVRSSWFALIAPLLVATSAPFLLYTARGSGMETALFTMLVLSSLLLLKGARSQEQKFTPSLLHLVTSSPRHLVTSGALLGLAAMTRPEGVLVAGVTGVYLLWGAFDDRRPTTDDRQAVVAPPASRILPPAFTFALGFLVIFGPYYAWRYSYYGLPLPNTFYVKVGASAAQVWRGVGYVAEYWRSEGLAWALGFVFIAGVWFVRFKNQGTKNQEPRTKNQRFGTSQYPIPNTQYLIVLIALVYTLYIVAVGGDWLPEWRFLVPLVPLYALLAQCSLRWLAVRARWGAPLAMALLALALFDHTQQMLTTRADLPDSQIGQENVTVMRRREFGRWMRDNTPVGALVAVEAAGALPYYSQRPAIDILGLNDRHIASVDVPTLGLGKPGHEKTDIPYVMDRQPTIIPYFSVPYLKTDPRFKQYAREQYEGPEGHDIILYRQPQ